MCNSGFVYKCRIVLDCHTLNVQHFISQWQLLVYKLDWSIYFWSSLVWEMCIYFSSWRLHWCFLDVMDLQRLEIRSIFGRYSSQHLDDTVTFKCWWNISRLSGVYNTMCFRVFLKASSILETSGTSDQKCYGPYDMTMSMSMKTSQKNRLRILLNIFAIIPIHHVT